MHAEVILQSRYVWGISQCRPARGCILSRPLLKGSPTPQGGGGGLWPVGGWVSLVWGNLAQSAWVWVGGCVGGRMARQPLFVHENTIFTERLVVKSGKSFRSAGSGDGTNTFMFVSAVIYH